MNRNIILYLVILLAISSCMEKNTTNPEKAYKYWQGETPPEEVKVLKAKYWESAHWSKEYEVFIEMKASAEWRAAVINENNFRQDSVYDVPAGAPSWFVPHPHDRIWKLPGSGDSFYLEDTITGRLLVYEIQL